MNFALETTGFDTLLLLFFTVRKLFVSESSGKSCVTAIARVLKALHTDVDYRREKSILVDQDQLQPQITLRVFIALFHSSVIQFEFNI